MTPRMRQVLDFIIIRGDASVREIAENFGLSPETAGVYLRQLRHMGRVRCVGTHRRSKWTTAPEEADPLPVSSVWGLAR